MKKLICFLLCLALLPQFGFAAKSVLRLPNGLQIIEEAAFYGDESLDEVVLPQGIKRIEKDAFAYSSLKHINLLAGLEYIDDSAFYKCKIEYATAESETWKQWCRDHGILTEKPDPYAGEPIIV